MEDSWIVYPFGHGLSYDLYSYEWLGHRDESKCQVSVRITLLYTQASSMRWSSTSMLLFLRPPADQASGLVKKLVNFQKVEFAPSQSFEDRWSDLVFDLMPSDFELVGKDGSVSRAAGTWTVEVNDPPELSQPVSVSSVGFSCGPEAASERSSGFLAKRVFLP